jgi:hypothetical protein
MNNSDTNSDKRNFSRIPFDADALIKGEHGEWKSEVLDISLKGALLELPENWTGEKGTAFELEIKLAPDAVIYMQARVAHIEEDHIGFLCEHIDLDSITHLRRIIELNTGDEELLNRELSSLSHK